MATPPSRRDSALLHGILPIQGKQTLKDSVAGFQLAAMNIPQALGYTRIAGTPIVTGFYTLLLPLLTFAALGSSRDLVVAADSATAAILAGGLSRLAPIASPHYMALASMVALLTAGFLLLARAFKLGFLADFLSQTVLVGFLTGVGFQVGIAVLGEMLGLQIQSDRTVIQLIEVIRDLPQTHLLTATISIIVVVVVFVSAGFAPRFPGPLVAVVAAIVASEMWNFAGRGVDIVGPVAGGLPHIGLPDVHGHEILPLIGLSFSCFVMIVAQSAATARFYATRHQQQLDEDSDLVGLSSANATASEWHVCRQWQSDPDCHGRGLRWEQSTGASVHSRCGRLRALVPDEAASIPSALCARFHRVLHRGPPNRY